MPLEDPTAIDIILPNDGYPVLIITDSGATADPDKRYDLFMQKLQLYVAAILDGALSDKFPEAQPNDYTIRLICVNLPTERMLAVKAIKPRAFPDVFLPVEFEQVGLSGDTKPQRINRSSASLPAADLPAVSEALSSFVSAVVEVGLKAIQRRDEATYAAWMEADKLRTESLGHFGEPQQIQAVAARRARQLPLDVTFFATWSDGLIGTNEDDKKDALIVHAYERGQKNGVVFGQGYQPKKMLRKFAADDHRMIIRSVENIFDSTS